MKILVVLIYMAILAFAAGIDPAFGTGGFAITSVPGFQGVSYKYNLLTDSIGNGYFVGEAINPGQKTLIVKYMPNGVVDTTYANSGFLLHNSVGPNGATIDAANDIYVVGKKSNDFFVARYDASGNVVATFGTGGIKTIDIVSSSQDKGIDIALDGVGGVFAAGFSFFSGTRHLAITKLDATSGALLSAFGTGGKTTVAQPNFYSVSSTDLKILYDGSGNIYVAAQVKLNSNDYDIIVRKFDATTGALDLGFGTGGVLQIDYYNNYRDNLAALMMDGSGNLYVAGSCWDNAFINDDGYIAVVKFNSTGTLDTGFDQDGIKLFNFSTTTGITDALIDANGDFYFLGSYSDGSTSTPFVFKTDGSVNPKSDFGTNGVLSLTLPPNSALGSLALLPDGDLLAGGREFLGEARNNVLVTKIKTKSDPVVVSVPIGREWLFGLAVLLLWGMKRAYRPAS